MNAARYVGRVGALAVALGIGVAVANGPAAWADDGEGSSSSSTSSASSDAGSSSPSGTGTASGGASSAADAQGTTDEKASEPEPDDVDADDDTTPATVSASRKGAEPQSSTQRTVRRSAREATSARSPRTEPKGRASAESSATSPSASPTSSSSAATTDVASTASAPTVSAPEVEPAVAVATPIRAEVIAQPTEISEPTGTSEAPAASAPAAASTVVLTASEGLDPQTSGELTDTTDSPIALAMYAAFRRMTEDTEEQRLVSVATVETTSQPVSTLETTSQTVSSSSLKAAARNRAPTAVGDSATIAEDTVRTFTAAELVSNDTDPERSTLSVYSVSGATYGSVVLNANGTVTFTPTANYSGPASFTYRVKDSGGLVSSNSATVSVTVTPVNDAPTAVGDSATIAANAPRTFTAAELVGNDTDPDGGVLAVHSVSGATSGAVALNADGTVTFTPTANYSGPASFTYRVKDQVGLVSANSATVSLTVNAAAPGSPTTVGVGVDAPNHVTVVGTRAYVVSGDSYWGYGTVTVIDTETNAVIDTIPTWEAGRVFASVVDADGDGTVDRQHVYVAGFYTVAIIDADPVSPTYNQVIARVDVPTTCYECYNGVWDVAVSANGSRLYAGQGDGSISVFDVADPTRPQYLSTDQLGLWDGDLEVTPDGQRLYVAHVSTDRVTVVDTATMAVVASIHVGPQWDLTSQSSETTDLTRSIAVSPDGTFAYVTQRVLVVERFTGGQTRGWFVYDSQGVKWRVSATYDAVSVIDLDPASASYNTEIARITVRDGADDIAVSPDGHYAYATGSDGKTVSVIDTQTNAISVTFTTDQTSGWGTRTLAVGADGRIYVTDQADSKLYISSV